MNIKATRLKNRFQNLRFKVHELSDDADVKQEYPKIFGVPAFEEFNHPHLTKVFKYICFLLDPKSDLVEEFPEDLTKRKLAAATEAGFPKNAKGELPQIFQEIVDFKNEKVNQVMVHFLRFMKNNTWRELVTLQFELENYTRKRWELANKSEPKITEVKGTIALCEQLEEKIQKKMNQLRGDHETLDDSIQEVFISPETVFEAIPELEHVPQAGGGYY
jgi:hypothetical protein